MSTKQVSAVISEETKESLDEIARSRGLKKSHIVEQALLHYMSALAELPDEEIVPPHLVLGRESWDRIAESLKKRGQSTEKLRELMSGR